MGKDTAILYMIRHGMTFGNSLSRYIGTTDEPVLDTELARLTALAEKYRETGQLPEQAASLWVSPLLRCRQTAGIFYPDAAQRIVAELRECDFGRFENKNYKEMDGDPEYQAWIDSNGTLPFPGGESVEGFTARTVRGLRQAVEEAQLPHAVEATRLEHLVGHRGAGVDRGEEQAEGAHQRGDQHGPVGVGDPDRAEQEDEYHGKYVLNLQ